jgi:nucleolar protein 56
MKATIIHSALGIFAFDAQDKPIEGLFFPNDVELVAKKLETLKKGGELEEIHELNIKLREKGYDEFIAEDASIAASLAHENSKALIDQNAGKGGLLRKRVEELALEQGHYKSDEARLVFLHDVSVAIARDTVQEDSGRRDLMVTQAILTLDDLEHAFNLFANRLREWFGYYFPEMGGIISDSDTYVRLISSLNERHNMTVENLLNEGISREISEILVKNAENSMGANLREEDLKEVTEFSRCLVQFYESRKHLENYLEETLRQVAPNTLVLLGPTLSARLIAITGGLDNLAKKSASTIQVLGAEKALFRSIRSGSRPPKHGLIFQHKDIHQAPRWQRGKIARALAGKVAIAVRIDAYHGDYRGEEIKKEFEDRVKEIQEKYPQPTLRGKRNG